MSGARWQGVTVFETVGNRLAAWRAACVGAVELWQTRVAPTQAGMADARKRRKVRQAFYRQLHSREYTGYRSHVVLVSSWAPLRTLGASLSLS